jgi:hypothetical protein
MEQRKVYSLVDVVQKTFHEWYLGKKIVKKVPRKQATLLQKSKQGMDPGTFFKSQWFKTVDSDEDLNEDLDFVSSGVFAAHEQQTINNVLKPFEAKTSGSTAVDLQKLLNDLPHKRNQGFLLKWFETLQDARDEFLSNGILRTPPRLYMGNGEDRDIDDVNFSQNFAIAGDSGRSLTECNPDLPSSDGKTAAKWVPLSAIRIPQRGARTQFSGEKGSGRFPTLVDNIRDRADPRGIICLSVCEEVSAQGKSIYWSEGTRRPITWLLGGLPEWMQHAGTVPVHVKNCKLRKNAYDKTIESLQNVPSTFETDEEKYAFLTQRFPQFQDRHTDTTSPGKRLAFLNAFPASKFNYFETRTPILMYVDRSYNGADPKDEEIKQWIAYSELKQYYQANIESLKTRMPLHFVDELKSMRGVSDQFVEVTNEDMQPNKMSVCNRHDDCDTVQKLWEAQINEGHFVRVA